MVNKDQPLTTHIKKYIGEFQTIYCTDYKFLYLKNAKTAGTSIYHGVLRDIVRCNIFSAKEHFTNNEFDTWYNSKRYLWNTAKKPKKELVEKMGLCDELITSTYLWTFIRNPYERLASAWNHMGKLGMAFHHAHKGCMTFESFIQQCNEEDCIINRHAYSDHWQPQWPFVYLEDGTKYVDFVGRYETLNEDFKKLAIKLGIWEKICEFKKWGGVLPIRNAQPYYNKTYSKGKMLESWKDFYTGNTKKYAAKYLEKDLDLFGYTFDS